MKNERTSKPIGFVMAADKTVYRLYPDMTWSITHDGHPMPNAAEILADEYEDFVDFPAYPGQLRLKDLAKKVKGVSVWLLPPGDPGKVY